MSDDTKLKCPVCGFKITVEGGSHGGSYFCEGDNWPHVDRGHHEQTEMEETRLSRWL